MSLALTRTQHQQLSGRHGPAVALAMRMVVGVARARGAAELVPVEQVHIDSCLYHGQSGIDFVRKLVDLGGRTVVPTTTNVGSVDLLHPELRLRDPSQQQAGQTLMGLYQQLGVAQTWTCAPYQLPHRPAFGSHIAWAESNAIVFANSVLGARTDRYGDFLDVCAALTGLAPRAGFHLDDNRQPQLIIDCADVELAGDHSFALIGYLTGQIAGTRVPLLTGLETAGMSEDNLKALGAAAASAGGVGMFHVLGCTPEARDPDAINLAGLACHQLANADLQRAQHELSTATGLAGVDAVCLGTPHASLQELRQVAAMLRELADTGAAAGADSSATNAIPGQARVVLPLWINTGRFTLEALTHDYPGDFHTLDTAGVTILTDTCTYLAPILAPGVQTVMTNSGKWAHYGPGNLNVNVVFASLRDCVATALGKQATS